VIFLGIIIFEQTQKWLLIWIRPVTHQLALGLVILLLSFILVDWLWKRRQAWVERNQREAEIIGEKENSVFCGVSNSQEKVFIKTHQRSMHTQVIGTTNAGKTESVILPWAIQDLQQGRGLILIDGKADRGILDKLYAYAVQAGRQKDFRLFSLSHIEESHQFNPLIGGTTEEICERVFNSFEFENPYYRSLQFEVFCQVMRIFAAIKEIPTFLKLHQAITDPDCLAARAATMDDDDLKRWLDGFSALSASDRLERTSGLTAALSHFSFGKSACLFNAEDPSITLEKALSENLIVYFQLPVLLSPFLGKATGKLVLQSLQAAVANRHRNQGKPSFYSVFLDDFTEYLYPGFVSILNKSRSANVGIVFAHQALGDIKTLGDAIANSILTNANLKVFMRGNDPESAEYFSKVIGTSKTIKYTERTKKAFWMTENTGDASAREVDEFIIHPNRFKNELGVGEAVMVIPHKAGSHTLTLKFNKFDDLEAQPLDLVAKATAKGPPLAQKKKSPENSEKSKSNQENYGNFKLRKKNAEVV